MKSLPAQRPSNPDVEVERPGWSIRHEKLRCWWSEDGFVRDHRKAKVYLFHASAKRAAEVLHGARMTTVPHFNGYCVEWREVETEEEKVDGGWVAA